MYYYHCEVFNKQYVSTAPLIGCNASYSFAYFLIWFITPSAFKIQGIIKYIQRRLGLVSRIYGATVIYWRDVSK